MRTVNIVSATNGAVVATVAGSAVQDGESATSAEPVTFTAIPAGDGFYVSLWTGNCSAAANGANDNAGGLPKTCVVPAGASPIQAGAAFAPVADCAAQNRNPGTNIRTCGNCKGGRVETKESRTCVPAFAKARADNCESAGWSVTPNGEECAIRVSIVFKSESHDSCEFVSECGLWFDSGQDGEVAFPQSSGPGDTRRFVVRCDEGKNPSAGNDAGQTMCCDEPTTQDPTTGQCQVTADSCRSFNLNAEPHPTDNTKCVCKSGYTGEPPACRDPNLASGLLPAGIPITGAISPADIPGADKNEKCETIGGTYQLVFNFDNCEFAAPRGAYVLLDSSAPDGLTFWRGCALQRKIVDAGDEQAFCVANKCPAGKVVRGNVCTDGTWNQCNELTRGSAVILVGQNRTPATRTRPVPTRRSPRRRRRRSCALATRATPATAPPATVSRARINQTPPLPGRGLPLVSESFPPKPGTHSRRSGVAPPTGTIHPRKVNPPPRKRGSMGSRFRGKGLIFHRERINFSRERINR